jgi:raffinose/stachyose/melibiose transport system permease protein
MSRQADNDLATSPPAARARGWLSGWVARRGWTMPLHLLLAVCAFVNLYPFIWMIGTSYKSVSEAAAERQEPLPRVKYRLSGDAAGTIPTGLTGAQLRTLSDLEVGGKADASVTPPRYMVTHGVEIAAAAKRLDELHRRGLLRQAPDSDAAGEPVYRLAAAGRGNIAGGLNARQLHMLVSLREDDLRRRQSMEGYAASRQYVGEYAANYRIDRELAQREIDELVESGLLVGGRLQGENYTIVWKDMHFYLHFLTSLVLTLVVVALTLLTTSMLGYALARLRFPGKTWVLALLIIGAVAPREAVIIPIFRMLKAAGALEGIWGMALWMTGAGIGNTFLMAGFFLTLPREVEEAAAVDGAGPFRTFFDVALPMARPIVMAVGLFAFLGAWNNFLIPLLCTISRPEMQPLAVAVYSFQRGHQGWWNQTNAAAAVMIVPAIVVFVLLQKHIVKSIAVGAVKG